ncbi:MAG: SgcJ/EcaC family oxidoreductase [Xanthobacteraceae bacterium]|nr:SgcJ/EcaC family oxidoreductase [Xanthobacteraceae bacterium]
MTDRAWTAAPIVLAAVLLVGSGAVMAGPAEDANAALDAFAATYTANDVDKLVQLYAPDAILLGTNSPIISEGRDAVRAYFTNLKLAGSGNKNVIQDRRTIVVSDEAVVVTGFYEFTRMTDGKPTAGPARFTVLLTRQGGKWLIAHQHSSPRRIERSK